MASKCMLTTVDNPFDPFEQFTSWFMFDEEKVIIHVRILEELREHPINFQKKKMSWKMNEQLMKF